ncbi:MAG: hypothetical protein Q4C12_02095 [Clostridia bacterium]|nr:hypothetical protein [Clostridia bacterium]
MNYNFENLFDVLVEFFNTLPKDRVKIINFKRYQQMLKTAAMLKECLSKTMCEGEITIDVTEQFNLGSVSTTLDSLTIDNPSEFINIVSQADNFEIYPLTNGKIRIDITFQSVLKTIEKEV